MESLFNEKPTYIKAIATKLVALNNRTVKYFESTRERIIIMIATKRPEIVSIIFLSL